jgi:hypothetical protein
MANQPAAFNLKGRGAGRKFSATPTEVTEWRIPQHAPKYFDVLNEVPKNGDWYVVGPNMGLTTAEQMARAMQSPWSPWQWGYRVFHKEGQIYSELAVRYKPEREDYLK